MSEGGFSLRNWISNANELMKLFNESEPNEYNKNSSTS